MSTLRNENGIALVTALLFTLISLGIMMALLAMVIQGTKMSAATRTYKNASEAGHGAIELVTKDIFPTLLNASLSSGELTAYKNNLSLSTNVGMTLPTEACLNQKLGHSTSNWAGCSADATTPFAKQLPDFTFTLKASNDTTGFKIYTKIVDTKCGGDTLAGQPCTNSDSSGIDYLDAGGGVTSGTGAVTPEHKPAYFRLEVQSERAVNPAESAQMSVLYAY